jgi:hypothetical protein
MSDFQSIVDRFEIEALHGEFTDTVMMRDPDRLASLFTEDGWKFAERVYEVRYLDPTPLAGSAPHAAEAEAKARRDSTSSPKGM